MTGSWTEVQPRAGVSLYLAAADRGVLRLWMNPDRAQFLHELAAYYPGYEWQTGDRHPVLSDASDQLRAYFRGDLREFRVPLDMRGTDFQMRVWEALRTIPYGETRSYRELAGMVGSPKGFRAAGSANGRNPIAIIVPCHRVIAADGSLGGFGGGLDFKRMLLDLESGQI